MLDNAPWAIRMADTMMQQYPIRGKKWTYEWGVLLKGIEQLWAKTGDQRYFDYIKQNIDAFVQPDGSILTYQRETYNIDMINTGKLLFSLYRVTGEERYQKAAHLLREQLRTHPRTNEGGFWHKLIYPHQMWLDGIYMGAPFYAEFSKTFDEPEAFDDIAHQVSLIAQHTHDPETGLFYHGWDESKTQRWADPETGCSPHFWGRALGWFMMALPDILDHFPGDHPQRAALIAVLQETAAAVVRFQDPVTGVWYQILDQGDRTGNYLEASASGMFTYALAKAARLEYIASEYWQIAERAFQGIVEHFITVKDAGLVELNHICSVAGLGGDPYRDGSFEYYISEPVVTNDDKGVGAFILAGAELEI